MVESQKRAGEEPVITSAAQLRGISWEGVRRTALDVVEAFCRRSGIDPAQFMSNMGMMRSDQWRQGVNWRECVNWNQFNALIFGSIPGEREGGQVVGRRFEQGRLTRTLRDMQESYLANATPSARDRTATAPAAGQRERPAPRPTAEQTETTPAPRASEQREERPRASPPGRQEARPRTGQASAEQLFTDRLVERGYKPEEAEQILDIVQRMRRGQDVALTPAQSLWENDINEVNDAWSRVSPGTRTARGLGEQGVNRLFVGLLLRGPGEGHVPPASGEAAGEQIAETRRPAPARQETYTYSVTYGVLDSPQSTFTFNTATPITDYSERWLVSALRDPPAGFVAMENGAPIGPERRAALADELELRARDPIGTFAIERISQPRQRREG